SSDSEIIAMTALGIGRRRILLPVAVLAATGCAVTLAMTLWLSPLAYHTFRGLETELAASQLNFAIQPRVFDERFPHEILYVNDISASGTQWRGVFLAETGGENASRVTLAESAVVVAEPKQGKLELHLKGGSTHDFDRGDPDHYSVTAFGQSDIPMEVTGLTPTQAREIKNDERSIGDLARESGPNWREARVELHRRFAFPAACFAFALIAVPIGAQPRRGGRAAGSLIAVLLIAAYYLALIMGSGLAREGNVPPFVGLWMANALLVFAGLLLLPRMEQFHSELRWLPKFSRVRSWIRLLRVRRARARAAAAAAAAERANGRTLAEQAVFSPASFPRLMDIYLLRRFFLYFAALMGAFVFLFEAFTFFELLDNIARNRIPFVIVVEYFLYLTPYLLYQLAPLAALVAI